MSFKNIIIYDHVDWKTDDKISKYLKRMTKKEPKRFSTVKLFLVSRKDKVTASVLDRGYKSMLVYANSAKDAKLWHPTDRDGVKSTYSTRKEHRCWRDVIGRPMEKRHDDRPLIYWPEPKLLKATLLGEFMVDEDVDYGPVHHERFSPTYDERRNAEKVSQEMRRKEYEKKQLEKNE